MEEGTFCKNDVVIRWKRRSDSGRMQTRRGESAEEEKKTSRFLSLPRVACARNNSSIRWFRNDCRIVFTFVHDVDVVRTAEDLMGREVVKLNSTILRSTVSWKFFYWLLPRVSSLRSLSI